MHNLDLGASEPKLRFEVATAPVRGISSHEKGAGHLGLHAEFVQGDRAEGFAGKPEQDGVSAMNVPVLPLDLCSASGGVIHGEACPAGIEQDALFVSQKTGRARLPILGVVDAAGQKEGRAVGSVVFGWCFDVTHGSHSLALAPTN
jgi:hypothetical protein